MQSRVELAPDRKPDRKANNKNMVSPFTEWLLENADFRYPFQALNDKMAVPVGGPYDSVHARYGPVALYLIVGRPWQNVI